MTTTTDDTAAPDDGAPDEQPEHQGAGAEAARWRTALRAAEGQRDALAARVETMQRRDVERHAGALADPGDVWAIAGADLPALLDEAGDVDPAAVAAVVRELLATRPQLAAHRVARAGDAGIGVAGTGSGSRGTGWGDVLRDAAAGTRPA